MSDCFVLYLLLTCMKKKTSGADKFTNNSVAENWMRCLELSELIIQDLNCVLFLQRWKRKYRTKRNGGTKNACRFI